VGTVAVEVAVMTDRYSEQPEPVLADDEAVLYRAQVAHATIHGCKEGCHVRQVYDEALSKIRSLRARQDMRRRLVAEPHPDMVPSRNHDAEWKRHGRNDDAEMRAARDKAYGKPVDPATWRHIDS
jgi:hypothetical protein